MLFALLAASCSKEELPERTLEDAWQQFKAGNYRDARDQFEALVGQYGAKAHVGIGWCSLRLDNLAKANEDFAKAPNETSGNAGWTFVKWALEDYQGTIQKADFVLLRDSDYVFPHDSEVNYLDLILYQAYSYFHLGNYTMCIQKVQAIDPGFQADPLDPDIESVLLTELETLSKIV